MSIIGKLRIEGQEFNLLSYRLRFYQERDIAGKPRGRVNGGLIQIQIEAHRDHLFHHWALQPEQMKDLEIAFSPVTRISNSRLIQCYDVFCVRIASHFDNYTNRPMTYTLLLSPGIIKEGSVVHKKPWHVTDIDAEEVEATPAPEQEARILGYYFSNMENKKITITSVGDKVYLNIRSRNYVGKRVTINLANPNMDFVYNGNSLKDDMLEDYYIESDHDRLLLEVIKENGAE